MKRENAMTDTEVQAEVERLTQSEFVRLARKEQNIINRQRQYLYKLRGYEKRGQFLAEQGYTLENIEARMMGSLEESE